MQKNIRFKIPKNALEKSAAKEVCRIAESGGKIGVACSGGADSVCALMWVAGVFSKNKKNVYVLHFNHRERAAADSDAEYSYGQIVESMRRLPVESARHEHPRVAVSRSHKSPELAEYIEELRKSHPDLEVVEQGSSYKFCLLAEGAVDYYFRTTSTYEWDTAAGELILSEVGGETLSLPDYRPLRYNKTDLVNSWFFCRARKMPGCRSEAEMMVGECSAAD